MGAELQGGDPRGFVVYLVCPDLLSWRGAAEAGGTELLSSSECVPLLSPTPTSAATHVLTANNTPLCTDTCLIPKIIKTNLTAQRQALPQDKGSQQPGRDCPSSQALLAVVPAGLVAPEQSHGRACDTSGRAAGPSGLVVPREGLWKAALGQRRKKTNIETHPAWRRRQSLCKAGSQHGCGQGTGVWVLC